MATSEPVNALPAADLHFDRDNPRLIEYGIGKKASDEEIISILWDAMDVRELVQSIAASGYFQHEPLIVAEEDGRNVVIEGNRRLAAVKLLLDSALAKKNGWGVPSLEASKIRDLKDLPVMISDREDSWRYLGFKHVNGPAKWTSYAKAKYIADVHRKYGISLADISEQIGDRHQTVQRLYRGLMVIEQAEAAKVYSREDRYRKRFAFSHLYTGLDYSGISRFLSLKSADAETATPVPEEAIGHLGELCVWLYGSRKADQPPVVESQNPHLRQLDAVVINRVAIAALRGGQGLAAAFEQTRPSAAVFEEALSTAKLELQRARAHLTTGFDGSEDMLRLAGSVANLADDVYTEMERKVRPAKKERVAEN